MNRLNYKVNLNKKKFALSISMDKELLETNVNKK